MSGAIKEVLRAHGLRVTAPRLVVLQALREGKGHLSAEEIYGSALQASPAINLVTVYRTLETFEAHGLATRVVLHDKVTRWESSETPHHHLMCRRCGAVVELDDAPFRELAAALERIAGVRADVRHLAVPGLCAICAAAAGSLTADGIGGESGDGGQAR